MTEWPWLAGSATGIGSLPGEDIVESTKLVLGELPQMPHLPELPARGPGADMIGRGAGLLAGLPVELYVGSWRIAAHPGRDLRRTRDLMERDLDTLTELAHRYQGPVKVQAVGPWTLAANLDLPIGGKLLHDHGAAADLAASLAEGLRTHVAEVARRMPGATVILQVDEPSVPAVLAGHVPTESGLRTLRRVASSTVESALRGVVEAAGCPVVVHCCATDAPLRLFRDAGAAGVAIDLSLIGEGKAALDELGELLDGGLGLFAGAVASTGSGMPSAVSAADTVMGLWRRVGLPSEQAARQVVVTPACGLAGATPSYAKSALAACTEAAKRLEA